MLDKRRDSMICKENVGFKELEEYISTFEDKKSSLIIILHKAQEIFGYIPKEVQEFIADKIEVPVSKVYGVVSFYNFFSMEPKGKYPISVCTGTACYVRGAEKILEALQKELGLKLGGVTEDGLFSLDSLRCVGACGLAPVMLVGKDVHGKVKPEDVKKIIESYKSLEK
jgi:NADH-quinone oxidoreductase E subunit